MNDLKYIGIIAVTLIIGAFIGLIVSIGLSLAQRPSHIDQNTVSLYTVTNYGTNIEYIRIARERLVNVTNVETLTNVLTLTQIIEIIADYSDYSEKPFIFIQSNDRLTASLHKRSADCQLYPWWTAKKWAAMVWLPTPSLSITYDVIDWLTVGAMVGVAGSNWIANVGAGIRW